MHTIAVIFSSAWHACSRPALCAGVIRAFYAVMLGVHRPVRCPAVQDERVTDPQECRRDFLETVQGWSSEITDAIKSTPLERITRSRIADRWQL